MGAVMFRVGAGWTGSRRPAIAVQDLPGRVDLAVSDADLAGIFRLRYDVYVREQQRRVRGVNHAAGQLTDASDAEAMHLLVRHGSRVVAAVRLHLGPIPPGLAAPLGLERRPDLAPRECCLVSKLMVRPDARRSTVTIDLVRAVYRIARRNGIRALFCTTFPPLVPLYRRMGFDVVGPEYQDPDFGAHHVLVGDPSRVHEHPRLRWLWGGVADQLASDAAARDSTMLQDVA